MITRYRPDTDEECRSFEMIEDKEGDYVAYEDYEDELADLKAEKGGGMSPFYCGLLAGLFIGALVGFIAAALMAMAGRER
jgi:hypothetical protein